MAQLKLTPAKKAKILELVRAGNFAKVAAERVGIGETCLYEHVKRDPKFGEALKSARAEAEESALACIRAAWSHHWQSAAWYLERSHPDRWGRRERVEVAEAPPAPHRIPDEDPRYAEGPAQADE